MDIEIVKKELLIAIRGKRSQTYISQKLGYDYNQVYRWESGRIDIAWTEFIKLCKVSRRDISGVLKRVFNFQDNPADYSRFLNHLIGNLKQKEIGTVIDCTPYRLRKWLRGQTSPTVVDFFNFVSSIQTSIGGFCFGHRSDRECTKSWKRSSFKGKTAGATSRAAICRRTIACPRVARIFSK